MKGELPLQSFEVDGFRGIRELSLPALGRVNLLVGKNNAGKTSLLEAVRLYLYRNERSLRLVLFEILRDHSGFRQPGFSRRGADPQVEDLEAAADAAEALFFGSFGEGLVGPIRMRPEPMPSTGLTIRLPWLKETGFGAAELDESSRALFLAPDTAILEMESEQVSTEFPLDWFVRRTPIYRPGARDPALMIPASGMEPFQIRRMWDQVAVAGQEGLVEEAVRTIVPDLDRVLLVGESGRRSVLFKVSGLARPVPIESMGDGVNRVFAIAVAMVLAKNGALLVDEIDNGLHFTVQDEVWQAIFSLAVQFDVQVFATSHSWDTLVGFQYAANQSPAAGMLYRLERRPDGRVDAIRFSEEEVEIAAEQQIEIR